MSKQYLIDEETLYKLLYYSHKFAILERDGVHNWERYLESYDEYIAECAAMLPWNKGKTVEDIIKQLKFREEAYRIYSLVADQIEAFWEEYKEPITAHWTGMNGDECSNCGRCLRDLMDADSCYSSEFESAGFDQLKACPFCGARMEE